MGKNNRASKSMTIEEKRLGKNKNGIISGVIFAVMSVCIVILMQNYKERKPIVCVWNLSTYKGHLQHVYDIFERLGYETTEDIDSDWDVMWAHEDPFYNATLASKMKNLKPYQRVNKIPGINHFITQKMVFSTLGGSFIPKSFHLPSQQDEFSKYAKENPDKLFLEKHMHHRGVILKSVKQVTKNNPSESFVQEFIHNPLLIGGHKFDFGIFVVVTSLDPLRVYYLDGDVIFRFCAEPYEPFNSSILAKYVIGNYHYPATRIDEIRPYLELSLEFKDIFDDHIRSRGLDPKVVWEQTDLAIERVFIERLQKMMLPVYNQYKHIKKNFFELVRFDFIVDDALNVYLLEVNMSPSLSSLPYPQTGILYDQILFSTLSLAGVSSFFDPSFQNERRSNEMMVAERNVMVYPEICLKCFDCRMIACQLCKPCLKKELLDEIKAAYRENKNQYRFKRIFPPRMTQESAKLGVPLKYKKAISVKTGLMYQWFQGKCLLDPSFC